MASSSCAPPFSPRVRNLAETFSGRAPSPPSVSSLGEETSLTLPVSSRGPACNVFVCRMMKSCSCAENEAIRNCPRIEFAPGQWVYNTTITDPLELLKQCVEHGLVMSNESVSARVSDVLVRLAPLDSIPKPCQIEGCGCEEGMIDEEEDGSDGNDADNEGDASK